MDLRLPLFLAAGVCLLLALLLEYAAADVLEMLDAEWFSRETPGIAINYLAIFDALLFYAFVWMVLPLVLTKKVTGRAQGIITLLLSLLGLFGTFLLAMAALALLVLMIALLVAVPFGTIAYFAAWGDFARGTAAATLALAMLLKLAYLVLAVLAHRGFLKMKGFLVTIGVSLGLTWAVGFIHAFVPLPLVSIGDALAALVIAIVAIIWLVLLLIGSLIATIKAILSLRSAA